MKRLFLLGGLLAMFPAHIDAQNREPLKFRVPLNHFYLVLDSKTYADIENSAFMRKEFAPSETRTTVRADRTYTGLYFYGINTYFEFFDVAKEPRRQGDSAIAFGVDELGAEQKLQPLIQAEPPHLITRQLGSVEYPWFWMLTPAGFSLDSGIATWVMEYDPRFLAEWHSESKDGSSGISRQSILQRYAAVLKEKPAHPVLQDVLAIMLALNEQTKARMSEICAAYGYRSRQEAGAVVFENGDFTLRLIPETATQHGIQQITLRVSDKQKREFRFGTKSVLTFHGDGTANWIF
jgi:hypothetical protein